MKDIRYLRILVQLWVLDMVATPKSFPINGRFGTELLYWLKERKLFGLRHYLTVVKVDQRPLFLREFIRGHANRRLSLQLITAASKLCLCERECTAIWGPETETRLSKVPSLCSRQSQHSDVPVLHLRSPAVSDLWTAPLALPAPSGPSDGYVPCRVQKTWGTWKSYSWQFLVVPLDWLSSAYWVKKKNIMADLHSHHRVWGEHKGQGGKMICMQFKAHIL